MLRMCAAVGISAVGLLISWWGASGTARLSTEFAWVNLGLAAMVLLGTTMGAWLLVGRRAVGQRQRTVSAALEAALARPHLPSQARSSANQVPTYREGFVWGKGMTLYHRADCQLVAGKALRSATVAAHERARRKPCQICLPS